MDPKDTPASKTDPIDEALRAGPIDPPEVPATPPGPLVLPEPVPGAEVVELDPPGEAKPAAGPALPQGAHVRPGAKLGDPARELQEEQRKQDEENQFLP